MFLEAEFWVAVAFVIFAAIVWKVVDGAIKKVPTADVANASNGKPASGGDLITDDKFDDFELAFQWKVTRGANGGRFGRRDRDPRPITSTPASAR